MVFSREEKEPVAGILPNSVGIGVSSALLVEDAVIESRTSRVMMETLTSISPGFLFSLFALEIEQTQVEGDVLLQMQDVYTFEGF
jgi:hypothetical protein